MTDCSSKKRSFVEYKKMNRIEELKQSMEEERAMRRELLANVAGLQLDLTNAAERSKERLQEQLEREEKQREDKIQSVRNNISKILSNNNTAETHKQRPPSQSPMPSPFELRERALNLITYKGGLPKRVPKVQPSTEKTQSSGIELYAMDTKMNVFRDDREEDLLNDSIEQPAPERTVPSPHPASHTTSAEKVNNVIDNIAVGVAHRRDQVQYRHKHSDKGEFTYFDECLTPEGFNPNVPSPKLSCSSEVGVEEDQNMWRSPVGGMHTSRSISPSASSQRMRSASGSSYNSLIEFRERQRHGSGSPSTVGYSGSPNDFAARASQSKSPSNIYSPLQSARSRSPISEVSVGRNRTGQSENPLTDLDTRRRVRQGSLDKYSPMRGRSPPAAVKPAGKNSTRRGYTPTQRSHSQTSTSSIIKRGYVTNKPITNTTPPRRQYKPIDKDLARQRAIRAAKALREQQAAPERRREVRTQELLRRTQNRIEGFCQYRGITDRNSAVENITAGRLREQQVNRKKRERANELREQWLQKGKEREREEYLASLTVRQNCRKRTASIQSRPPLPGTHANERRRTSSSSSYGQQKVTKPSRQSETWEASSPPGETRADLPESRVSHPLPNYSTRTRSAVTPINYSDVNSSFTSIGSERVVTVNLFDTTLMSEPTSPGGI